MPQQLYTVTLTAEVVVLAESPEDAKSVARRYWRDEDPDAWADEMRHVPGDYDDATTVYVRDGVGPTLGDCLARGLAPRMKERS